MKTNLKRTALALALLAVAACSSTVTSQTQSIDYSRDPAFKLNAVKIEVVSDYQPRNAAPSVDHMMDKNPQAALVEWAKARLRAAGTSGYAQVKIKDASVTSRVLETEGGVKGYFTREGSEELVARLEVEVRAENSGTNAYTVVEASQILTVPEGATAEERRAIDRDLINKLMAQFNQKATDGINKNLYPLLVK